MIVDRDVAVPMRDQVVLRADVYRPEGKAPVPAVLSRTPYDRSFSLTPAAAIDPERAVAAGLAVVCQDVRGQHGSDGHFYPFRNEGPDGYDSVEWVAGQPWCADEVAMVGRSYTAATQWLAAAERPPHLRAIVPLVVGSNGYDGWVYQGGAFQLGFNLFWIHLMTGGKKKVKLEEQYRHLPLTDPPLLEDNPAGQVYRDWLEHPTLDDYWRVLSIDRSYDRVQVPAFNVGGWYDIFLKGTLQNFSRLRSEGGSGAARTGTRLLVGPWAHGSTYGAWPDHGFEQFAPEDRIDLVELQLAFLTAHLNVEREADPAEARPVRAGGDDAHPVRIFVMGENRWRDEPDWPLARAREERWYLRGEGGLSTGEPADGEPPDRYDFDPRDPAPTIGGPTSLPGRFLRTNSGPLDQRPVEERADVLVYSSKPLDRPLEVTGPLALVLHAATSAADADFMAKLCDVEPDGVSRILAEGVLRLRFREGFQSESPVEAGEAYQLEIDLVATSNVFKPGHRIRLCVTSSSFPRFDRNAGTGAPLGSDRERDLTAATQTVFHDFHRPSHLLLPVVPSLVGRQET